MNLDKAFNNSFHWGDGDFSATQLLKPSYQLWKEKQGTIDQTAEDIAQMVYGTAMHEYLERNVHEPFMIKEMHMQKEVDFDIDESYLLTGTADYIYHTGKEWVIGDYKTKGAFSAKKFETGEDENEKMQLSIYRWMMQDKMTISRYAEIKIFVYGDLGRTTNRNRLRTEIVELYDFDYVEKFVKEKIAIQRTEPEFDCILSKADSWRCDYCSAVCEKNSKLK